VTKFELTPAEVEEVSAAGRQKHHRRFWTGKFAQDDRS
jgi:hypothetical protein